MAHINNRIIFMSLAALFALVASSCNGDQPVSNQQNANRSANAAKSGYWVAQYRSPASLDYEQTYLALFSYNDISVVSRDVVFVACDMPDPGNPTERVSVVVRTTDGGRSWTELPVEQKGLKIPTLNTISFVTPELGWVAGVDSTGAGVVLKTTDGGATWAASKPGFKQVPTRICFIDSDTGWMAGLAPAVGEDEGTGGPSDILMTTDGGATWKSQRRIAVSLQDIFFLDKSTGWAAGSGAMIYHTTDGGLTWDGQRSELDAAGSGPALTPDSRRKFSISGIHFVDKEHGWASATDEDEEAGRILGTASGGATWTRQRIVDGSGVRDVFFAGAANGWAATNQGLFIHYTQDGGQSWTAERIDFLQQVNIYRLGAADASHAWAVGGGAIFYRVIE